MKLKKRLNLILTFILSMTMVFGSVLTASASESDNTINVDNIFYDGTPGKDPDTGKYKYVLGLKNVVDSSNWSEYYYEFYTTNPICSYYYQEGTWRESEYSQYNLTDFFPDFSEYPSTITGLEYIYSYQIICENGEETFKDITDIQGHSNFYRLYYKNSNGKDMHTELHTNIPAFGTIESAKEYINNGDDSGVINKKPVVNNSFYLKNVGYSVRAENSSEYPDETYIKFTWDIDNLQEGDLLEIRTRNHYTKIGGDQVIGFHDYIIVNDGISCYSGSYEMSQTDAVKSWFATLDNKPLVFKDYDTDIYFLRPVRGNQYGLWVKITMGRKGFLFGTPTSSPYIKDIEYGNITDSGDWITDDNVTTIEGGNHGIDQNGNILTPSDSSIIQYFDTPWDLIKYLFSNLSNLMNYFSDLPTLINNVIGWLPNPIIVLICASIAVVIILRIFGR